jgi:hypothetical protein
MVRSITEFLPIPLSGIVRMMYLGSRSGHPKTQESQCRRTNLLDLTAAECGAQLRSGRRCGWALIFGFGGRADPRRSVEAHH